MQGVDSNTQPGGPTDAPKKVVSPERQALLEKLAESILKKRNLVQKAKEEQMRSQPQHIPKPVPTPTPAPKANDATRNQALDQVKTQRYKQLFQLLLGIQRLDLVVFDLSISIPTLILGGCVLEGTIFIWPLAEFVFSLFSRVQITVLYCLMLVPVYRLFRAAQLPVNFQLATSRLTKDDLVILDAVGPFVTNLATKIEEYQHFKKIAIVIDTGIVFFVFLVSQFLPNDSHGKRNEILIYNTYSGARVLALWVLWLVLDLARQGLQDALVECKDPYQAETIHQMRTNHVKFE